MKKERDLFESKSMRGWVTLVERMRERRKDRKKLWKLHKTLSSFFPKLL